MIRARAPGKVVLWGEYAVLAGAPALVMAVNRFATCSLAAAPDDRAWHFSALGHPAPPAEVPRSRLAAHDAPATAQVWHLPWHVLQALDCRDLPEGGRVELDTRAFHVDHRKLGLGSSAALCATVYAAFCRLLGQPAELATALAIHRRLQGGAGSGLDVAAAWHGGTIRFERGCGKAWRLPDGLHLAFVWAGVPARTVDHLARFEAWRERDGGAALEELAAAARGLFDHRDLLVGLADYVAALRALDQAAGLGIYNGGHEHLAQLAMEAGVVYKPCGAGGGDIGAAFAPDPHAAERFLRLAADKRFLPVPLEIASHGVEVTG